MAIKCYAADSKGADLKPYSYDPGELGEHEVEIKVTHCGICHSDVHLLDNEWGMTSYPFVPGHEVVGHVSAVGSKVNNLKLGQRVGVGWQCETCGHCEYCARADDTCCIHQKATCVGHHGGFSDAVRADSRFAFPIPERIESPSAAPLFCAGVTVYTPIRNYARSYGHVGVIGIGGLGHLAIQYAHAFGCDVTAFSSSPDKVNEAMELGADRFILQKDDQQMKKAVGSVDVLISVVSTGLDWPTWFNMLRPRGTLVVLGASPGAINIPAMAFLSGQKRMVGSVIGNRATIVEMLEFSARHNIRPMIETMPMESVNQAITRVRENQVRYRMVLEN